MSEQVMSAMVGFGTVYVEVTDELEQKIREHLEREGVTPDEMMEKALEGYLAKRSAGGGK